LPANSFIQAVRGQGRSYKILIEEGASYVSSLEELEQQALQEVAAAADAAALDAVRVRYLGKKGALTDQLKQLGKLPADQRPAAGQAINKVKQSVQGELEARKAVLDAAQMLAADSGSSDEVVTEGSES